MPANWLPRIPRLAMLLAAAIALLSATLPTARAAGETVSIYYAGSLVSLNENLVGPAFSAATGYTYQGKGGGSGAIANQIKGKIAAPDVAELADPAADAMLEGTANGDYVSWYFTFATSQLVIGFDPKSPVAAAFRLVREHRLPWYRALQQRGIRLGRTDPAIDPKGYRAIWMARLAERVYKLKGFTRKLLRAPDSASQVFPEQVLVARMLTGQINAGIFYLSEVKELGIPYITLPPQVNLGSTRYAKLYATQHFTLPSGTTVTGAPIQYTITIPNTVKNRSGALAFVRFVLSQRVRALSAKHGLLPLKVTISGDASAVPSELSRYAGR